MRQKERLSNKSGILFFKFLYSINNYNAVSLILFISLRVQKSNIFSKIGYIIGLVTVELKKN